MKFTMRTYNSIGELIMDQSGSEAELRELGKRINEVRGQKTWRSALCCDGKRIATCRRGEWEEADS